MIDQKVLVHPLHVYLLRNIHIFIQNFLVGAVTDPAPPVNTKNKIEQLFILKRYFLNLKLVFTHVLIAKIAIFVLLVFKYSFVAGATTWGGGSAIHSQNTVQ